MKILDFISKNNWAKSILVLHAESNLAINAPYHNLFHTLVVADSCLAIYEDKKFENEVVLNSLICAALFHDFNHSQGKEKDDVNVQVALNVFLEWYKSEIDNLAIISSSIVLSVIKATQYPYIIDSKDLTETQKIIRDADFCQLLQTNRIQQVYVGLASEMRVDFRNFLEGELAFIETIQPHTDWFRSRWEQAKPEIIKEVNILLNCYEKPSI